MGMTFASRGRKASVLVSIGVAALLSTVAIGLVRTEQADAKFATGGAGRYLDAIDWIEWGTHVGNGFGDVLNGAGPVTRTSTTTIAGVNLALTCTLSNFAGDTGIPNAVTAYRPGRFAGDAMDELYNIGGPDEANTFVNAVKISSGGTIVSFDYACSAKLGGVNFPLRGLVFGDAEQSSPPDEFVQASVPSTATWRIIDRYRDGCVNLATQQAQAIRTDDGITDTLRLTGSAPLCTLEPDQAGPAAVAFADGATAGRLSGRGASALALGAVVTFDRGDAPASYGEAAHADQYPFQGGDLPNGVTTPVSEPFALATTTAPPTRLGPSVDPGGNPSANADGDDSASGGGAFGADDDETEAPPAAAITLGAPGTTITQAVACTGPGTVAGWIDFDASGTFDAAERQSAPCTGTSVDLTWTVSASAVAQPRSFMRLRIAANGAEVASPIGLAATGEVEDHKLALLRPDVVADDTGSVTEDESTTIGPDQRRPRRHPDRHRRRRQPRSRHRHDRAGLARHDRLHARSGLLQRRGSGADRRLHVHDRPRRQHHGEDDRPVRRRRAAADLRSAGGLPDRRSAACADDRGLQR
jgi:hypothetical protein